MDSLQEYLNRLLPPQQPAFRPTAVNSLLQTRPEAEISTPENFVRTGFLGDSGRQTANQLGLFGLSFAPGAGFSDFSGSFPSPQGGTEPSAAQNLQQGNYLTSALQTLGAFGDAVTATGAAFGPLGLAAGMGVGSIAKAPRAVQRGVEGLIDVARPKIDEMGFFSQVEKSIMDNPQAKGTGQQFLAQLQKTPGVKPEEVKILEENGINYDELIKSGLLSSKTPTLRTPQDEAMDIAKLNAFDQGAVDAVKERTAIRDEAGNPLRLYHGSERSFSRFDIEEDQRGVGGIWLTNSKNYAYDMSRGGWDSRERGPGGQIIHAYLDVNNPLEFDVFAEGIKIADDFGVARPTSSLEAQELLSGSNGWDSFVGELVSDAKRGGYDAVVIKNFNDGRVVDSTAYVVFNEKSIAIERVESNDPNILN